MITFEEIGLLPELVKAIKEIGFEKPTPIQEKTIPLLLNKGIDLIGLAQTGTGKTAAFGLPILQKLDITSKNPEALIICPTRELCIQIEKDLKNYTKYMPRIKTVAIYGGSNIHNQINKINEGVQVVIATPGRLNDIIRRKKINLNKIKVLVLDEADEMLNMGFKEELNTILEKTPTIKRTLLFSATMPKSVEKIAMKYLNSPITITIGKRNSSAKNIKHIFYQIHEKERYSTLKRIVDYYPNIYGIIFCRTKVETKEISEKLIKDGYNADAIHGDLSQTQRDYVMKKFRSKIIQLLVATDVAARGLDILDISHIINYNLPDDLEIYTHRSGRTARAGKSGSSIALINKKEKWKIKKIENIIKKRFEEKNIPKIQEIYKNQIYAHIQKIKNLKIETNTIEFYLKNIYNELSELSKEDIIKKFVYMEFKHLLKHYSNSSDNITQNKKENAKNKTKHSKRIFLNIGSNDNLKPTDIIGFIKDITGDRNISIGNIKILQSFSFVEIEKNKENLLINSDKKIFYKEHKIKFRLAKNNDKISKKNINQKEKYGRKF